MSWDERWDAVFRSKETWGRYPQEELVRFVAAHYNSAPVRSDVRILELGCGPGAGSSWYVAREGFQFFGVDGSPTAIELAEERFRAEGLSGQFIVGDIEKLPWGDGFFDCVIDVACLQHNSEAATSRILKEVHRVLREGGRLFSYTAAAGSWGDGEGTAVDGTSFTDVTVGPYQEMNMGLIRFAPKRSLLDLHADFRDVPIERSLRTVNEERNELVHWILHCVK